jgi:hypothetical protein
VRDQERNRGSARTAEAKLVPARVGTDNDW